MGSGRPFVSRSARTGRSTRDHPPMGKGKEKEVKVAVIGLGNMGSPMAHNLIKAGHQLTVYNRTRNKAEAFRGTGARVAATPAEAVQGIDVLITMLADDHAVEDVLFAPHNALQAIPTGAVHVSMSTISVALSRKLAKAHEEKQQGYLAAPVMGRPDAASAAKLFVIAAGPAELIERCRPLFTALSQRTFVAGDVAPAANTFKLAANFLITAVIEGLAEASALVRSTDLDPAAFLDFLTNSLFSAPIYRTYGSMIAADRYEPVGFKLPLGLKDNRLLLAAAEETAVPMPLASLVRDRFLSAMAQGMTDADWSAVARISFQSAGLEKGQTDLPRRKRGQE
ncbi:MAG: NAD(P)-dependent oxidoreductase [Acidobacteriota bacterium]